jgi:hypothetical protein
MLQQTSAPADACYLAALQLVVQIEARLVYGRPIIDKSGRKLQHLEDVIDAILKDNLPQKES